MASHIDQAVETLEHKKQEIKDSRIRVKEEIEGIQKDLAELMERERRLQLREESLEYSIDILKGDQKFSAMPSKIDAPQASVSSAISHTDHSDTTATQSLAAIEYKSPRRRPMDMLKDEFKDLLNIKPFLKLGDLVSIVLSRTDRPMDTEELTKLLYDTDDLGDFRRCRNSLSSELRDGINRKPPQWKKTDRTHYASTRPKSQSATDNIYHQQPLEDLQVSDHRNGYVANEH